MIQLVAVAYFIVALWLALRIGYKRGWREGYNEAWDDIQNGIMKQQEDEY